MAREYDVVVIGSGSAGYSVAAKCREAGLSAALVESRGFGGTCPLRGCNPKKVLVNAAAAVNRTSDLHGKGVENLSKINWPELMRFKRSFTEPKSARVRNDLTSMGVDTFHDHARFTGKNQIRVGPETLVGRHIFIGAGMVPRKLDIPGEQYITTSEQFLELENLPPTVTFIGGGYISFEFAHVAARAGSRAVILHRSQQPLRQFDPEMVDHLVEISREAGIEVHLNMPVVGVEKSREGLVAVAGKDGGQRFESHLVVHGAGRVANLEGLGLEIAGVEASKAGVTVNEYLQSVSNPAVYAGGDAADTPYALTPSAYLQGRVAALNIIRGKTVKVDFSGIPQVVFSLPPLASVGRREAEAREQGLEFETILKDTSKYFSTASVGLKHSWMKLLTEKGSRRILGAHVLAHHAEETINVFALAIRLNLTVDDLKEAIWAYPTSISDIAFVLA